MWPSSKSGRRRPDLRCRRAGLLACCLVLAGAACGNVNDPIEFQYTVEEVASADLPQYDVTKLYAARQNTTNIDSLLNVLVGAKMPVSEIWLPLSDACASAGDPVGPHLTVVLEDPRSAMSNFNFDPGNGIRACTMTVRRYVLVVRFP